jgi:hypothetical protein
MAVASGVGWFLRVLHPRIPAGKPLMGHYRARRGDFEVFECPKIPEFVSKPNAIRFLSSNLSRKL